MASWVLVPCLVALRDEFNQLSPGRDRSSDGSIGDQAHAGSSSDHNPDETGSTPSEDADSVNEVHAIDVDKDGPWPAGFSMELAVQTIVLRHRNNRDDRLQNVIYNGRIWSRSWGWTARVYTGANQHRKHAHFSARYTSAQESDTRPWGLLNLVEDDMPLTNEDKAWIKSTVEAQAVRVWTGVSWNGESAAVRLAKAALAAGKVDALDLQMDTYAAADAARDADLPGKLVEALGTGRDPEHVAASLRQVPGVDWAAVGRALAEQQS